MKFGKCDGGGRRAAQRTNAPVMAVLSTLAETHSAALMDISRTGARLRGENLPEEGKEMILTVENIRTFGAVVWKAKGQCGVVFDGPLPTGEVNEIRHMARKSGRSPELRAAFDDWNLGVAR